MLEMVWNLLSILGIALLILLGLALTVLLLLLFFPITYRVRGQKSAAAWSVQVKADWLFGLIRARFAYPDPGRLLVKAFLFTVFDSGEESGDKKKKKNARESSVREGSSKERSAGEDDAEGTAKERSAGENNDEDSAREHTVSEAVSKEGTTKEDSSRERSADSATGEPASQTSSPGEGDAPEEENGRFSAKYAKIKYTIHKIYDKIRHIWEEFSFYRDLLTEENTRELFAHACFRVGRILKGIRPRTLKADLRFGAAAPDTTGYLYGAFCMLSPKFGKDIHVTPDFEQAVFEGNLYAAGHIAIIQLLFHGAGLLLDKKFGLFLRRLKKHGAQNTNSKGMEA